MGAVDVSIHAGPTLAGAIELLESAGLPAADLMDAHMRDFFYCGAATAPRALVGVELCGSDALLRSLVVASDLRRSGIGGDLVRHAEKHARECGARAVYLLTTTAEQFFRARGYETAVRETAPPAIRATREFAGLCPASSAFLFKIL